MQQIKRFAEKSLLLSSGRESCQFWALRKRGFSLGNCGLHVLGFNQRQVPFQASAWNHFVLGSCFPAHVYTHLVMVL
ncbi:hypothetical protein BRADI_1g33535v3 [Brachypodium distachyon]|uniref:Uncharacterized protein n=1 Tax=Brachypodium distachyon TaxID=15368 RepID=A0A0Q3RWZ6_BRADI|nr:hypothetical protein BRADI_1g33535v3 [Brachypodium distachyon]